MIKVTIYNPAAALCTRLRDALRVHVLILFYA